MNYSGSGADEAQKILDNSNVKVIYFAILIILVALVAWYLKPKNGERMEVGSYYGYGLPYTPQSIASGPDLRFQEFSMTNQDTVPTPTVPSLIQAGLVPGIKPAERLTARREAPVFYDISRALGSYQDASQYACPDGSSPIPAYDDATKTWFVHCGKYYDPAEDKVKFKTDFGKVPESQQHDYTDYDTSGREFATVGPSTSVQEALLMTQLGY